MPSSATSRLHFPAKLYQIIESENPEIIRWEQDGKSFRIVDHARFESELLHKYFSHQRISSVQRQLNLYGFHCISRGEDKGCYYHPKFSRGMYDSVRDIRRLKARTRSVSDSSDFLSPFPLTSLAESVEQRSSSPSSVYDLQRQQALVLIADEDFKSSWSNIQQLTAASTQPSQSLSDLTSLLEQPPAASALTSATPAETTPTAVSQQPHAKKTKKKQPHMYVYFIPSGVTIHSDENMPVALRDEILNSSVIPLEAAPTSAVNRESISVPSGIHIDGACLNPCAAQSLAEFLALNSKLSLASTAEQNEFQRRMQQWEWQQEQHQQQQQLLTALSNTAFNIPFTSASETW